MLAVRQPRDDGLYSPVSSLALFSLFTYPILLKVGRYSIDEMGGQDGASGRLM